MDSASAVLVASSPPRKERVLRSGRSGGATPKRQRHEDRTPYFTAMESDSTQCDAVCEGENTQMCGGKSKSSISAMHMCASTEDDLGTRSGTAGSLKASMDAKVATAKGLSGDMQNMGAVLQKTYGAVDDSGAGGLMQDAKEDADAVADKLGDAGSDASASMKITEMGQAAPSTSFVAFAGSGNRLGDSGEAAVSLNLDTAPQATVSEHCGVMRSDEEEHSAAAKTQEVASAQSVPVTHAPSSPELAPLAQPLACSAGTLAEATVSEHCGVMRSEEEHSAVAKTPKASELPEAAGTFHSCTEAGGSQITVDYPEDENVACADLDLVGRSCDPVFLALDKVKVNKPCLCVSVLQGTGGLALTAAIARAEADLNATQSVLHHFANVCAVLLTAKIEIGTWLEITVDNQIVAVLRRGNKVIVRNAHGEHVDVLNVRQQGLRHTPIKLVGRTFSDRDLACVRQLLQEQAAQIGAPSQLQGSAKVRAIARAEHAEVLARQVATVVAFHYRRASELIRAPDISLDTLGVAVFHFVQAGSDNTSLFPLFKELIERWYVHSALQQNRLRMCRLDIEARRIDSDWKLSTLQALPEEVRYTALRLELCLDEVQYALAGFDSPIPGDWVQLSNHIYRLLESGVLLTAKAPPASLVRQRLAELIIAFGNAASAAFGGEGSPDTQLLLVTAVTSLQARISA